MKKMLAALFACALAVPLLAQTFRGGIQGTVTDSAGASITGADVTVKSTDTGLVRTAKTDDTGNFLFSELPLGSYSVTVSHTGFGTRVLNGVTVGVSANSRADVQLNPGEVKQ
jgi:hypothetical protein